MLLEEIKEQVFKLPPSDRLALVSAIIESLQDTPISESDRSGAIRRMRGLLTNLRNSPSLYRVGMDSRGEVGVRCPYFSQSTT
ncbi:MULTISPECIES: addiction module protein [Aerosakkonema]|uniref:addiction module protein n=1 Tax=Aerosakkonema TaxID=1246629 RepID=UPI0035BB0246